VTNKPLPRLLVCLLITLFIINLFALPVASAGQPPDPEPVTDDTGSSSPPAEMPAEEGGEPCKVAEPPATTDNPPPAADTTAASSPDPLTEAQAEANPEVEPKPDPDPEPAMADPAQCQPGNSYIATVIPEDGKEVIAGEETTLTVIFTEVGSDTETASARLYIPDSLTVDQGEELNPGAGWDYRWENPSSNSSFSAVLSLWAVLESAILGRNQSVTVDITVTASADQAHSFQTEAWQDRAVENGSGVGVGTTPNAIATSYSDPQINVAVNDYHDLALVHENLNWHYVQQADIDLDDMPAETEWQPIGSSADPFRGSYNGNNHTISNLNIDLPNENYVGLFGQAGPTAVISDLTLENCSIEGNQFVGGLVGWLDGGVINNVHVSGNVKANSSYAGGVIGRNYSGSIINTHALADVRGTTLVGGLAGQNFSHGEVINSTAAGIISGTSQVGGLIGSNFRSLVERSSSAGTVTATSSAEARAGGLIGYNSNDGAVNSSFSTAAVVAASGSRAGGLVGENNSSTVYLSYAEGSVNGQAELGGLVGTNYSSGQIANCYATGAVNGGDRVGGLVGLNTGIITNTYATGTVTASTNAGGLVGASNNQNISGFYPSGRPVNSYGTRVEPADLQVLTTFTSAGWQIDTSDTYNPDQPGHWFLQPEENNPILWWQYQPAPPVGEDPGLQNPSPANPAPQPGFISANLPYFTGSCFISLTSRNPAAGSPFFTMFHRAINLVVILTTEARLTGNPQITALAEAAYFDLLELFRQWAAHLTASEQAALQQYLAALEAELIKLVN